MIHVVIASKSYTLRTFQEQLACVAEAPDIRITLLSPAGWPSMPLESLMTHHPRVDIQLLPSLFLGKHALWSMPSCYPALRRLRPDILHFDEFYTVHSFLSSFSGMLYGIPSIFSTYQNIYRQYPLPFSAIERFVLRHSSGAIAHSEGAASVLRRKGFKGRTVITQDLGVDTALFTPGPRRQMALPYEQLRVGFAGRLVRAKGVDVLVDAFARLAPGPHLYLAGDGPLGAELQQIIARLHTEGRVHLFGHQPSSRMAVFMNEVDVLVLPSRTTLTWKEQFGRVLVEAMATGMPVLGSDSGEIPAVIGDAGLIHREGDAEQLAAQLAGVLQDDALRRSLGDAARRRATENYDTRHLAHRRAAFYRSVVGTPTPSKGVPPVAP
ncbi:MAG: glycosyltransferase [Chloroflexi bacterium]|nr:glycosyltransferase [Chloroflexota bacterium]